MTGVPRPRARVRSARRLAHVSALLALSIPAGPRIFAQMPTGRREVVTVEPRLGSIVANAPIPTRLHVRNEGSDVDQAGLCVIASLIANGAFQGVPGLEGLKASELWKMAKAEAGGYYDEKLRNLLKRVMPDEKWVSWEGTSTELLEEYSSRGYPLGTTMNTAELYQMQGIHHMVSNGHVGPDVAMYVDNNAPGEYHWITRAEFDRRYVDGAAGWTFVWLRRPDLDGPWFLASAGVVGGAAFLLLASHRLRPI